MAAQNNIKDPFQELERWIEAARQAGIADPNAMVLSTLSIDGSRPSSRVVLFKGVASDGLSFYTNFESRKGAELAAHPIAAGVFFWHALNRQVRVEGKIVKLTRARSETYFSSRPRESQIGAWASSQSQPIGSREILEKSVEAFEKKFSGQPIPCPPHWGGYALVPDCFEFWIGHTHRLHDRFVLKRDGNDWIETRLSP